MNYSNDNTNAAEIDKDDYLKLTIAPQISVVSQTWNKEQSDFVNKQKFQGCSETLFNFTRYESTKTGGSLKKKPRKYWKRSKQLLPYHPTIYKNPGEHHILDIIKLCDADLGKGLTRRHEIGLDQTEVVTSPLFIRRCREILHLLVLKDELLWQHFVS